MCCLCSESSQAVPSLCWAAMPLSPLSHLPQQPVLLLLPWWLQPSRAGLQLRLGPSGWTSEGIPSPEAPLSPPQLCSRNRVWHRGWAAATPARAALNHHQHIHQHFLLLFYFLSPAAAEGWSHGQPGQRAHGPLVQTVSFTHTALSSSDTPPDVRWRGKGENSKKKGMQTCLL